QLFVVQTEPLDRADAEVVQQHVARGGETQEDVTSTRLLEIERQRSLAVVMRFEEAAETGAATVPGVASRIAGLHLLDLDYVRAEVREDRRCVRAVLVHSEVEHANTGERKLHRSIFA